MIAVDPEEHGYIKASELPDLDHMWDHMQGVLEALYTTGDMEALESSLEEVCAELNVPMPKASPKINLQYHLGYQRGVIDSMNNRTL